MEFGLRLITYTPGITPPQVVMVCLQPFPMMVKCIWLGVHMMIVDLILTLVQSMFMMKKFIKNGRPTYL